MSRDARPSPFPGGAKARTDIGTGMTPDQMGTAPGKCEMRAELDRLRAAGLLAAKTRSRRHWSRVLVGVAYGIAAGLLLVVALAMTGVI
jgi:hypothetical protein